MAGPGLAVPAGTRSRTLRNRDMCLLFFFFCSSMDGSTADLRMEAPRCFLLARCCALLAPSPGKALAGPTTNRTRDGKIRPC